VVPGILVVLILQGDPNADEEHHYNEEEDSQRPAILGTHPWLDPFPAVPAVRGCLRQVIGEAVAAGFHFNPPSLSASRPNHTAPADGILAGWNWDNKLSEPGERDYFLRCLLTLIAGLIHAHDFVASDARVILEFFLFSGY
jgi:hypothetical protein